MSIEMTCPDCARPVAVPDELLGKRVRCPSCKQPFTVRAPEPLAEEITEDEPIPEVLPARRGRGRSLIPERDESQRRPPPDELIPPPKGPNVRKPRRVKSVWARELIAGTIFLSVACGIGIVVRTVFWFIFGGSFLSLSMLGPQKIETPQNDEQLTQVLAVTHEADGWRRKDAFEALARAPVLAHRRQEVVERAIENVNDGNGFTREAARQTVRHWAGPDSVPALLKLIDNSDGGVRQLGLDLLNKQPVDEALRAEVTNKVLERIKNQNDLNRDTARPLLKKWATPNSTTALVDLLDHNDAGVRHLALEVLGDLRDPRALERIWLRLGPDREQASKVLQNYGPAAEALVLQSATDRDAGIRLEACRILNRIGTANCLPTLRQLQKDRDRNVRTAASEALVAVNARIRK